jgi:hypothetical protein
MYQELALADLVRIRAGRPETAARELARYESAFLRWEDRASVRRKPRRILDAATEDLYFPPELLPVTSHQLVLDKDPEVVRRILVCRLYDYLNFTTELEELAVIPVAGKISRGRAGLDLPEQMRADAFKIVTDEAWHAQFSYDFAQQVELKTGVPQDRSGIPAFVGRLDVVREHLPTALRGLEGLLFAIVSETLISGILADIPRDTRLPRAVRDLVRDHAEDEGRHHVYFRTLLRYLWPALDKSQRQAIGPLLPEIVFAFLEPDYVQIGRSLRTCGLTATETEQVLLESWPAGKVTRDTAEAAEAVIRYFGGIGAFDDPGTAAAFEEAGLPFTP